GPSTAPMRYRITDFEPPHRVVLVGEGRALTAVDEIVFSEADGGTNIAYTADLDFKGVFSIMEQLFEGRLHKIGEKAVDGMVEALQNR
ncbi:MAG: short-chain dehydrogenase, partial [Acidimicrobiia bacterium]|nr:short-chain dehydrogenase [Acidimicrobiia bacterium]